MRMDNFPPCGHERPAFFPLIIRQGAPARKRELHRLHFHKKGIDKRAALWYALSR